jgi:hypothetical protein
MLQLKYPGFFDDRPVKDKDKPITPIPNMTHPENDIVFLEQPPV